MSWYDQGYWAVHPSLDTAKQYLAEWSHKPADDTPIINRIASGSGGEYVVHDGGGGFHHACTLDWFLSNDFDYVIASIPDHLDRFTKLAERHPCHPMLLFQVGNDWPLPAEVPVLASVEPRPRHRGPVVYYRQEFDLGPPEGTWPTPPVFGGPIASYVNTPLRDSGTMAAANCLREALPDAQVLLYGGQGPDGGLAGASAVAASMRKTAMVCHVKSGGDGYGHVWHTAFAAGRPVIYRTCYLRGRLGARLLAPGVGVDLDDANWRPILAEMYGDPERLADAGAQARASFERHVDFAADAEKVREFLARL